MGQFSFEHKYLKIICILHKCCLIVIPPRQVTRIHHLWQCNAMQCKKRQLNFKEGNQQTLGLGLTVVSVSIPINACCMRGSSMGMGLPFSSSWNSGFRFSKHERSLAHAPSKDLQYSSSYNRFYRCPNPSLKFNKDINHVRCSYFSASSMETISSSSSIVPTR